LLAFSRFERNASRDGVFTSTPSAARSLPSPGGFLTFSRAICSLSSCGANRSEHVWPDWLDRGLLRAKGTKFTIVVDRGEGRAVRDWETTNVDATVPVCHTCNNGWMSDLEATASRFLKPMIAGEVTRLDSHAQKRVAMWTVKTAATSEQLDPPSARIPSEHRRHLRDVGEPAPGSVVLIGAREPSELSTIQARGVTIWKSVADEDVLARGYCTTITIDHFVAQVFSFPANVNVQLQPSTRAYLTQIWPTVDSVVTWRPTPALDGEGVQTLVEAFTRSSPPPL
jgi:hypothetical protein